MSKSATQTDDTADSIGRLALVPPPRPDRLAPMLFLAALVHGVLIIGITFNAVIGDFLGDAVSLEVTIVADPDRSFDRSDEAMYRAQASQEGAGNTTEQVRPGAPLESSVPIDNAGSADGDALDDAVARDRASDELLSTLTERDIAQRNDPRKLEQDRRTQALAMESGEEATLPLPKDAAANFLVRDQNRQQIVISADTRESNIAGYVDRWKRKIESTGERHLPADVAVAGLQGSPTLEVTIDANGELSEVVIRRSSGSAALDRAALTILERAAPFEPFPEAIRSEHPELNFVYKWRFRPASPPSAARLR
ncbi:MAG: TonB family protein [Woeseiaceae bacterium]|nr:TonB family protein [Woeseiaceae bacterium]